MVDLWRCNFAVDLGRTQLGRRFLRSCFQDTIWAAVAGGQIHSFDDATGTGTPGGVAVGVEEEAEVDLADGKAEVGFGTRVVVAAAADAEQIRGRADFGFGSFGAVAGGLCDDNPVADTDQLRLHCSIVTAAADRLAGFHM